LSESGLAAKFVVFPSTAFIYADVKRLKQLFGNLFTNAVKYAGDGDTLQLKVELSKSTDEIHIQFEDNGAGVDSENLPKLFEHLFRVENSRNRETGGSGLGLSICKKIVEAHHGKITAFASNLGGLGILIILPME
jgi:two-component system sensor histidine kinase BaeS